MPPLPMDGKGNLTQEEKSSFFFLQLRGCDIGRTTYAKYESGELNIRASVLIALHDLYACSFDEFFKDL